MRATHLRSLGLLIEVPFAIQSRDFHTWVSMASACFESNLISCLYRFLSCSFADLLLHDVQDHGLLLEDPTLEVCLDSKLFDKQLPIISVGVDPRVHGRIYKASSPALTGR